MRVSDSVHIAEELLLLDVAALERHADKLPDLLPSNAVRIPEWQKSINISEHVTVLLLEELGHVAAVYNRDVSVVAAEALSGRGIRRAIHP